LLRRANCAGDIKDGLWKIRGARQVVYARADLSIRDRLAAAKVMTET
jgi:hypothetical protein